MNPVQISNAGQCPLCQRENHCVPAQGGDPTQCWCMQTAIDQTQQLRARAVDANRCVCQACAAPTKSAERKNL